MNLIFNKILGRVRINKGITVIEFWTIKGLTDIVSLFYMGLGSFLLIWTASHGTLFLWKMLLFSMICCVIVSSVTFIFTRLSPEGEEGETRLITFLERNLELKELKK